MPLVYQALLPFAILLGAAGLASLPDLRQRVGAIAPAATGIAGVAALVVLLELKPSERVDLVYLRAFPGADLALRLDGLSLAFAVVLLATATGLMVARVRATGDRRNPWRRWLLPAAAALGVVLAGNLLLTYIGLQVLTLAWSGAVDEAAPRTRRLRLAQQAGDLALLIAAASAIRSAGTSAFVGMPADAIDPLVLLLLLVPVTTRAAAVVLAPLPPRGTVAFVPAVAWVAPGAALLLRVLSLAAGRPFDRPVQGAVFSVALLAAAGLCLWAASAEASPRFAAALGGAHAGLRVALGGLPSPLATVGCAWGLVLPVARTVRSIPVSTVRIDWFGFVAGGMRWPVTLAGIAALMVWAGLAKVWAPAFSGWRLGPEWPALPRQARPAFPSTIS